MSQSAPRPRAWQRMLSGRRLDLLEPAAEDIEIEDIAHGLARVARWNGQTHGPHALSVAQHAINVMLAVRDSHPALDHSAYRAALLHDAAEYVIGDLISPFKAAIGHDYKAFENRLLDAIFERFGISDLGSEVHAAIKDADRIVAYFEATRLAGFGSVEAEQFFGVPSLSRELSAELDSLQPWPTNIAQQRFLDHFHGLRSD